MLFSNSFLKDFARAVELVDTNAIESMVAELVKVRTAGGRLFIVGSGGGAGHASHAVCDFRKLAGIEAYCPTDNVSELTARINDDGWDTSISNWLSGSRISAKDGLLVISVGGGSEEKSVSMNLVRAIQCAKTAGATVLGIVGRDGGFTAKNANAAVVVPTTNSSFITPITESMQAVVWHLLVSHPALQVNATKWESTAAYAAMSAATAIRTVKVFADGADLNGIMEMYRNPMISGFTTNPTLMRKAGITDYRGFAREVLSRITDRPISFEVFSDDIAEMEAQAREIASWGENVYVKIPITNTKGESCVALIQTLGEAGIKVNCTAVMTEAQIEAVVPALAKCPASYLSIFAGRIADSGRDPLPIMKYALKLSRPFPGIELIWASPRELLNIIQADEIGCQVITVTNDILKKLALIGKDLNEYSLETVKMFRNDALAAGFTLDISSEGAAPRPGVRTVEIVRE